jgi:hypothetical protein
MGIAFFKSVISGEKTQSNTWKDGGIENETRIVKGEC